VRSTASLRFGCYPCLVQAESEPPGRQLTAPGSCFHRRVGPDFRQPSLLSHRPLSPRGSRRQSRPFTRFRFATPCEAGGISQVWMLPLIRYGRIRAPWPPSSCARILHPSSSPVTGADFRPVGLGETFHRLSRFHHPVAFTSRFPSDDRGLTTLLSIAHAGVARLRPGSGRHPSSLRRKSASWPPTILRQAPTHQHSSRSPERAFRLSPRRLSSGRFPISVARLATSRC